MKITNITFFLISLSWFLLISCNQQGKQRNMTIQSASATDSVQNNAAHKLSATDLHERLMLSFDEDWMERETDPDLYPDYYGGSFIDNSGTFVIAVTGAPEQYSKQLSALLGTDNFHVERVQYSYKQMMQVMDRIDAFLVDPSIPENHPVMSHFAGAYPDVMENRVKVMLTEVNQELINTFKKDISNSPMVVFEQGEIPELF